MVARPLFGHGLVYFVTDYERPELWAVRPDGQGDVTDSHLAWAIRRGMPAQPLFLLIGDLLYLVNDEGVAYAIDAQPRRRSGNRGSTATIPRRPSTPTAGSFSSTATLLRP